MTLPVAWGPGVRPGPMVFAQCGDLAAGSEPARFGYAAT